MAKLNQIIALQVGKKTAAKDALTQVYHQIQKPDPLTGISRSYRPKDEDGEQLPAEAKRVQVSVPTLLKSVFPRLIDMLDITATLDKANTDAIANVEVDGVAVLMHVPVTTLLFLEKQLIDLNTLVEKLPVLDPSERWNFDPNQDCYASDPSQTIRSKKIPKTHVKYDATDKHPAQVEMYTEDISVGTWTTVKYSGSIPVADRNVMSEKIRKLQDAVKIAREEANSLVVNDVKIGEKLLNFVFGTK